MHPDSARSASRLISVYRMDHAERFGEFFIFEKLLHNAVHYFSNAATSPAVTKPPGRLDHELTARQAENRFRGGNYNRLQFNWRNMFDIAIDGTSWFTLKLVVADPDEVAFALNEIVSEGG